ADRILAHDGHTHLPAIDKPAPNTEPHTDCAPPKRRATAVGSVFGCKVEFSASADEIVLPDSIGQVPISSADPYLNELLIDHCEEALSRRKAHRGSLRPDLENAIALLLPHGKAYMGEISHKVGMSQRTLARRLAAEGLTFAGILDELKLELAKRYLQ